MTTTLTTPADTSPHANSVSYRHLGWAGVELRSGSHRLLIDPLEHTDALTQFLGPPRRPLVQPDVLPGVTTDVLLTHVHPDHFDPEAIRSRLCGERAAVWVAEPLLPAVTERSLPARSVVIGETYRVGPFSVSPVPASDGFGDVQISWIISRGDWRCFHGGDTIWHGHWSRIARDHGAIDVAFMPVNGFIGAPPGAPRAEVPGSLTPHEAAEAAHLLGARAIVPIHYGVFHNPPYYVESPDVLEALAAAAARRGITVAGAAGSVA